MGWSTGVEASRASIKSYYHLLHDPSNDSTPHPPKRSKQPPVTALFTLHPSHLYTNTSETIVRMLSFAVFVAAVAVLAGQSMAGVAAVAAAPMPNTCNVGQKYCGFSLLNNQASTYYSLSVVISSRRSHLLTRSEQTTRSGPSASRTRSPASSTRTRRCTSARRRRRSSTTTSVLASELPASPSRAISAALARTTAVLLNRYHLSSRGLKTSEQRSPRGHDNVGKSTARSAFDRHQFEGRDLRSDCPRSFE